MAYTTIDDPTIYMNPVPYTGTEVTLSITGVGFQPDLVWLKKRGNTSSHWWTDVIRGVTETLYSNATTADTTESEGLTAFGADGFTLGDDYAVNQEDQVQMSWNWKANGAGSSNGDGDITSTVSANTTAGFSIVSYTGDGNAGATVGHGLGSAPSFYVVKTRDSDYDWRAYHKGIGETKYLNLNQNIAVATATNAWNDTAPTSSVFSLGDGSTVNQNTDNFIAYCFAEKQGYSKFGSYNGNGNADGAFVYTGFRPAWVMVKKTNGTDHWFIIDNKRIGFNSGADGYGNYGLYANLQNAEYTGAAYDLDILSNGFKARDTDGMLNGSGDSYIYAAFAEAPFVNSNGVPCNAR